MRPLSLFLRLHRAGATLLALAFAVFALVQPAAATGVPLCQHGRGELPQAVAGGEPQGLCVTHASMHDPATTAPAETSIDTGGPAGCHDCGACHFACGGIALAARGLDLPPVVGGTAPIACNTPNCASRFGETPHRPPRADC